MYHCCQSIYMPGGREGEEEGEEEQEGEGGGMRSVKYFIVIEIVCDTTYTLAIYYSIKYLHNIMRDK